MKIAVTGKGGVGKTTLAAIMARIFASSGKKVLAVDADPDANLAQAIGFTKEEIEKITPISGLKSLIKERTGAEPGSSGSFFSLNPKVDDIPNEHSISKGSIKLLVLGTVEKGGAGCICPESALLRQLVKHLVIARDEVVIMDMEAGIEHLGRSTADAVDVFIIVIEPGLRSVQTAKTIEKLAKEIGVGKMYVVVNKVRENTNVDSLVKELGDLELLGILPDSQDIQASDLNDESPYEADYDFTKKIEELVEKLDNSR